MVVVFAADMHVVEIVVCSDIAYVAVVELEVPSEVYFAIALWMHVVVEFEVQVAVEHEVNVVELAVYC